jgi:hypothetical protein
MILFFSPSIYESLKDQSLVGGTIMQSLFGGKVMISKKPNNQYIKI